LTSEWNNFLDYGLEKNMVKNYIFKATLTLKMNQRNKDIFFDEIDLYSKLASSSQNLLKRNQSLSFDGLRSLRCNS